MNFPFYFSYVQHRIEEHASIVRELLLERNGIFLVAGNSKNMPIAVKEAVVNALNGDSDRVEQMIKTGRYQEETWAWMVVALYYYLFLFYSVKN